MNPVAAALATLLAFASVQASKAQTTAVSDAKAEIVTKDVLFPEGPIFVGDTLYFVDYTGNDVLKLDPGGKAAKVWHQDGCGQSGLVQSKDRLYVTCYDNNTVVAISLDGKVLDTTAKDDTGQPMTGPNDLVADGKGGIYFSASGVWEKEPIVGKVFYRAPDGKVREVAADLHYSNGAVLSPDGKRLYVAETYASRIVSFAVADDGALSDRREFAKLDRILADGCHRTYGPDGLRMDRHGNFFVGLYEGGGFAVLSPEGKLLKQVDLPAPHDPNLAISPDGKFVYSTGVFDAPNKSYRGELYRVPNPIAE